MKMSKALVWAVSVALTFSLVGCGPKQTAPVFQAQYYPECYDPIAKLCKDQDNTQEVKGAALATVLSQFLSFLFVTIFLLKKNTKVRLGLKKPSFSVLKKILKYGASPFLIIATDSILLIVLNTVLQRYGGPELGDTLVTCATIVQSYLLLITMPMGGLTLGSQPVVSFNYGAANLERIKRAIQSIVALCVTFCVLMTVVTHTLSPVFVGLFTQNPEVAARSVRYIKVFTAMIIPLAIQYPLVDETTALGHVRLALFCSIFRKCVFLAGLLLLIHPQDATAILPMAAGIYILFGSVMDIQTAVEMHRFGLGNWVLSLILGILNTLLGFYLLFNPFSGASALMMAVGICLIVGSIQNLYSVLCISKAIRDSKKDRIIDVEWSPMDF